jgi:hypothetical protein
MLEGRGCPTGTAVLLRWQRSPPSQRGPQSRRWGGRLAGTCQPAHVGTAGLLPVYTSVFAVISAWAYPPLPGGQVAKLLERWKVGGGGA